MEGEAHSRPSQAGSPGGYCLEGEVVQAFTSPSFISVAHPSRDRSIQSRTRNSFSRLSRRPERLVVRDQGVDPRGRGSRSRLHRVCALLPRQDASHFKSLRANKATLSSQERRLSRATGSFLKGGVDANSPMDHQSCGDTQSPPSELHVCMSPAAVSRFPSGSQLDASS